MVIMANVRVYAPDEWGTLERFSRFYESTFQLSNTGKRCVSGAQNHFHKAHTFCNLAEKLVPNLKIDENELLKKGFTRAENASELSAVIESIFLELYSALDCARKVITEICGKLWKIQGVPDSTRKMFEYVKKERMTSSFPKEIISTFKNATWYEQFRRIRDELTHQDTGRCYKDSKTGVVTYNHDGIVFNGKGLVIENIFQYISELVSGVNNFLGHVFSYFYAQLSDQPVRQICGFFQGRVYSRLVKPSEAFDFNGGICSVKEALKNPLNPACPFMESCGAYKNAC